MACAVAALLLSLNTSAQAYAYLFDVTVTFPVTTDGIANEGSSFTTSWGTVSTGYDRGSNVFNVEIRPTEWPSQCRDGWHWPWGAATLSNDGDYIRASGPIYNPCEAGNPIVGSFTARAYTVPDILATPLGRGNFVRVSRKGASTILWQPYTILSPRDVVTTDALRTAEINFEGADTMITIGEASALQIEYFDPSQKKMIVRVPSVISPEVPGFDPPNIRVTLPAIMVPPNVPTVTIYSAAVDRITIPDVSKPLVNGTAMTVVTPKTGSRLDTTVKNITGNLTVLTRAGNLVPLSTGQSATFSTVTTATHDISGDARSDIAWRDNAGNTAVWLMNGSAISTSAGIGQVGGTWAIVGQRDFDGNGKHDLLWKDGSGNVAIWFMNGTSVASMAGIANVGGSWNVIGTADFDGDGKSDILWRDTSGNVAVWMMDGSTIVGSAGLGNPGGSWTVAGLGDFNADGKADVLWKDASGNVVIWFMNGTAIGSSAFVANVGANWNIAATGDLNGDGKADIIWRDTSGNVAVSLMNGATISSTVGLGNPGGTWAVQETGDFDGDGKADVLWKNATGTVAIWFMNGTTISSSAGIANVGPNWSVQTAGAN